MTSCSFNCEGRSISSGRGAKPDSDVASLYLFRTKDEISSATNVTVDELIHKETDDSRVKNPKWLWLWGLFCWNVLPLGQVATVKVNLVVWFCPCHGQFRLWEELEKACPLNLSIHTTL